MMRNQLTKAINLIDAGVKKLKSYSSTTSATNSMLETKKNISTEKFVAVENELAPILASN
jgi:hypothetical protein